MSDDALLLKQTREFLFRMIAGLTDDQLLTIPPGFRNNILWNLGHTLVVQQQLTYGRSGLNLLFEDTLIERFRRGSSPAEWSDTPDISFIKEQVLACAERFIEDYRNKKFTTFSPYKTAVGPIISSVEEAIRFNLVHEGMHMGYIMAMRKLV